MPDHGKPAVLPLDDLLIEVHQRVHQHAHAHDQPGCSPLEAAVWWTLDAALAAALALLAGADQETAP